MGSIFPSKMEMRQVANTEVWITHWIQKHGRLDWMLLNWAMPDLILSTSEKGWLWGAGAPSPSDGRREAQSNPSVSIVECVSLIEFLFFLKCLLQMPNNCRHQMYSFWRFYDMRHCISGESGGWFNVKAFDMWWMSCWGWQGKMDENKNEGGEGPQKEQFQ